MSSTVASACEIGASVSTSSSARSSRSHTVASATSKDAVVRLLSDGTVRVRLRNIGADPVAATVTWDGPGAAQRESVPVGGHGVADVLLPTPP